MAREKPEHKPPTGIYIAMVVLIVLATLLTLMNLRPETLPPAVTGWLPIVSTAPTASATPAPPPTPTQSPAAAPTAPLPEGPTAITDENWQAALCGPAAEATFSEPVAGTSYRIGDTIRYAGQIKGLPTGFTVWQQLVDIRTATFILYDRSAIIAATEQPSSPAFNGDMLLDYGTPGPYKLVVIMANQEVDSIYSSAAPREPDHVSLLGATPPGSCVLGDVDITINA